jgi:hypothetical protein
MDAPAIIVGPVWSWNWSLPLKYKLVTHRGPHTDPKLGNRIMNRSLVAALVLVGGFAIGGLPALTYLSSNETNATETTPQKKKKKQVKTNYGQTQPKKKNYCGYPQEPTPAGMSDYCSYMYNIYCRRGVGCSIYGREY